MTICEKCGLEIRHKSTYKKHIRHFQSKGFCRMIMKNITINIPNNYDYNIQKLIRMKLIPSRSEAVRTALREFLNEEYNKNLELLEYGKK